MLKPKRITATIAMIMLVITAILWGSSYTASKIVLANIPLQTMMAIRMWCSGIALLIFCIPRFQHTLIKRMILPSILLSITYFAGFSFQMSGLTTIPAGRNAFLTAMYCVFVPFITWSIVQKRPSIQQVMAAIICIIGVGFISLGGHGGTPDFSSLINMSHGDMLSIIGAFFYGLNIVLIGLFAQQYDAVILTCFEFLITAIMFTGAAWLYDPTPQAQWFTQSTIIALLYLIIGSSLIAQTFQNVAVAYVDTMKASIVLCSECLFGLASSAIILHEIPAPITGIGLALIFASIVLSQIHIPHNKRHTN